jgi:hypothetical protein
VLAVVLRWSLRILASAVVFGALGAGLLVVWSEGPTWWAIVWAPVFAFLGLGAAVWMADNL